MSYIIQFQPNSYFSLTYDYNATRTAIKEEAIEVDTRTQADHILSEYSVRSRYELIDYETAPTQTSRQRAKVISATKESVRKALFNQKENHNNYAVALLENELIFMYPDDYLWRYQKGRIVEKIKNFEHKNCRFLEWKGESVPMLLLCDKYGITYRQLSRRLAQGWKLEDALTTPIMKVGTRRQK
jgi:hypothetical protein